jgi:hypothetical protein
MRSRQLAVVALVAGAVAVVGLARRAHHHGTLLPRFRRDVRERLHSAAAYATHADPRGRALIADPPAMPKPDAPPSVAVYRSAIEHGDDHPGAKSFRADVDLFVKYNHAAVAEQARKEGVTEAEVEELTYFGYVALRTTQASTVERAIGRQLTGDEQRKLDALLTDENQDFTARIHKLVDDGAPVDDRWRLIREFEQDYQQQFATLFGVTPQQFDDMLAPDPAAPVGAPAVELPSDVPVPASPPAPPAGSGDGALHVGPKGGGPS